MSDIFVSYAREDRDRVEPLVHMLESLGLKVWWDRELHAGDSFEDAIDKAILDSSCVVVIWSKHSIESQWVRNEALEGMERHILVPLLLDDVRVPIAFKQLQSVNFVNWPNKLDEVEYDDLIKSIDQKLGGAEIDPGSPDAFLKPNRLLLPLISAIGLFIIAIAGYLYIAPLEPSLPSKSGVEITPHALADDPITYRKFLQALDRIRRGDHEDIDQAIQLLNEVTVAAPNFSEGYAILCQSLLDSYKEGNDANEYQQAEKSCNRALFLDQNNAEVYIALGELFAQSGEHSRSEEAYQKAIELDQSSSDAHVGLGFVLMKQGKILDAESEFNRAVVLDPNYVKAQLALGSFFFQQGLYNQAVETYKTITDLAPENALAWNNLGVSKMLVGEFHAAFEAWDRASQLKKNSGAYSNMGYVLYLLGRFEEAAIFVNKAIDTGQSDHRLWGNLGDILRFVPGREKEMLESYDKAIKLAEENRVIDPDSDFLLSRLAVYYAATNNHKKARENIELIKKQAQNDIYILFDMAVALSILGEEQAAKQQLMEAKSAGYPAVLMDADPQFH